MGAHAPLFKPFERSGLAFFLCEQSWRKVFADTTNFFSREFSLRGDDENITDTLLEPLNSSLFPQYIFCWVRYMTEDVRQKLSWKLQPYLFWFGLIPAKWKQGMGILKMPPFCLHSVTMEILSLPSLYTHICSRVIQACALILPLCS